MFAHPPCAKVMERRLGHFDGQHDGLANRQRRQVAWAHDAHSSHQRWPASVGAQISIFSIVELPGIEPGAEIALNCDNGGIDDAERRQTTRDDLRVRESC
jgi:hypothetical protein